MIETNRRALMRLLMKERDRIAEWVIRRIQSSPASSPEYSAFLASRIGRLRVRRYVDLSIRSLEDPRPFFQDQRTIGESRASQGFPLSGVMDVSIQVKQALWNIVLSELVRGESSVPVSLLHDLQQLEAALDASRVILSKCYVDAREKRIRVQSEYLESVYKLASSAFSSRELSVTIKELISIARAVFDAPQCGIVLALRGVESDASVCDEYHRLSPAVKRRIRRVLDTGSPTSIKVKVVRDNKRRFENWLVSTISAYGEPVGLMYVCQPQAAVGKEELNLLRGFSSALGGAVANFRLFQDLAEKEEVLRALVRDTIESQEDERKQLAADIHDGPTQSMMAALYRLEACEGALARDSRQLGEELAAARDGIARAVQDLRRIIYNLRPLVLDDLGLVAGIRSLAKALMDEGEPHIVVEVEGNEERLPGHYELVLYRIVQESLNNIRRHSKATAVNITLRFEQHGVWLTVTDNGSGFLLGGSLNELAGEGKFGLIGMRERVERLGGRFGIKTTPNEGTEVSVWLCTQRIRRTKGGDDREHKDHHRG